MSEDLSKNAYILLVVSVSETTLAKNLTSFYKTQHTLQPWNFPPTYTQGNLLHFCFKRHDKNAPRSKGKDLKTTECPSTGEWIYNGVFPQQNSVHWWRWMNYSYKQHEYIKIKHVKKQILEGYIEYIF